MKKRHLVRLGNVSRRTKGSGNQPLEGLVARKEI